MARHSLTPDGHDTLWAVVEPRLRRIGAAFRSGSITFEQYKKEIASIRNLLGI